MVTVVGWAQDEIDNLQDGAEASVRAEVTLKKILEKMPTQQDQKELMLIFNRVAETQEKILEELKKLNNHVNPPKPNKRV